MRPASDPRLKEMVQNIQKFQNKIETTQDVSELVIGRKEFKVGKNLKMRPKFMRELMKLIEYSAHYPLYDFYASLFVVCLIWRLKYPAMLLSLVLVSRRLVQ